MKKRVQLFTAAGFLVATAEIELANNAWPTAVSYAGHTYALTQGRYLRVEAVAASPVETAEAR